VKQALQLTALFAGVLCSNRNSLTYLMALAEFRFRRLGKLFTETNSCDKIVLCKVVYFVRDTGLMAE
jgi:hypothetical protein